MDENVDSLNQEEISPGPSGVVGEVPRFWKTAKILFKGLLCFFLFFIFYIIINHFFHFSITILDVFYYICGFYILFLIFKWVFGLGYSLEKTFRLFALSKKNVIPIFFISISLYLFGGSAGGLIKYFLDKIGINSPSSNLSLPNEWWNLIISLLSMIVLAPIMEELIFRGIILNSISKSINIRWAIIISSLLFGIVHISPVYIIVIGLSAIMTAWIVIKTNSILSGIIIHFINNSLAASFYLLKRIGLLIYFQNLNLAIKWGISIFILIFSILMMIFGIIWLLRNLDLNSQRPITFISNYFRKKHKTCPTSSISSETIDQ